MKVSAMKPEDREAFLREPTVAKLATIAPDGSIRMSPLWFRYESDGTFLFGTWSKTAAVRNLQHNPSCSLLIDQEQEEPYYGIHLTGRGTVEGPVNDVEGIASIYAPYSDIEAALENVAGLIQEGEMVFIRFTPEHEISWDFR